MNARSCLALAAAVLLLSVPSAVAQSPVVEGYARPGGEEQERVAGGGVLDAAAGGAVQEVPEPTTGPLDGDDGPVTSAGDVPAATDDAPTGGGVAGDPPEAVSGELPFTGAETAWVLGGGLLLLAIGLFVRRLSALGPRLG